MSLMNDSTSSIKICCTISDTLKRTVRIMYRCPLTLTLPSNKPIKPNISSKHTGKILKLNTDSTCKING